MESPKIHQPDLVQQFFLQHLPFQKGQKVLDLGTGSGVLALCAAKAGCFVFTTDIEDEIGEVLQENARLNNLPPIPYQNTSHFDKVSEKDFDLILTNMPQTPAPTAIVPDKWGGPKGSLHNEKVLREAKDYLAPQGATLDATD